MTATNDDLLDQLKKISNLLQGMYLDVGISEQIKNSSDVKSTMEATQKVAAPAAVAEKDVK